MPLEYSYIISKQYYISCLLLNHLITVRGHLYDFFHCSFSFIFLYFAFTLVLQLFCNCSAIHVLHCVLPCIAFSLHCIASFTFFSRMLSHTPMSFKHPFCCSSAFYFFCSIFAHSFVGPHGFTQQDYSYGN